MNVRKVAAKATLIIIVCILLCMPASAYNTMGYVWSHSTLRWYWGDQIFDLSSSGQSTYMTAWENAVDSWNDCDLDASFLKTTSTSYADFTVDVGYTVESTKCGYTAMDSGTDGYVRYCAAYINMNNATVTGGTARIKQSVAAHELGHVFGLDEVSNLSALMCQNRNRSQVYKPTSDEIAGVNDLY